MGVHWALRGRNHTKLLHGRRWLLWFEVSGVVAVVVAVFVDTVTEVAVEGRRKTVVVRW
jgi:hypothetical protein